MSKLNIPMLKKILLLMLCLSSQAKSEPSDVDIFAKKLLGKEQASNDYFNSIKSNIDCFTTQFIEPIDSFVKDHFSFTGNSLFYPFAGPDISYPLLFFPNVENYTLVGMEFPGLPDVFMKDFQLELFKTQLIGYLNSGFFKTMNMSAQMHYRQGVIPILLAQIALLGGEVTNVSLVPDYKRAISIEFIHNNLKKRLYYFRMNLDDSADNSNFYAWVTQNKLSDNCMIKASSYKLQQIEFGQMRAFILKNCSNILQDDTGMQIKLLLQDKRSIKLFGNYIRPYGDEFKPYFQQELANLYLRQSPKIQLNYCFGYGCKKVEANILAAQKNLYSELLNKPVEDKVEKTK